MCLCGTLQQVSKLEVPIWTVEQSQTGQDETPAKAGLCYGTASVGDIRFVPWGGVWGGGEVTAKGKPKS